MNGMQMSVRTGAVKVAAALSTLTVIVPQKAAGNERRRKINAETVLPPAAGATRDWQDASGRGHRGARGCKQREEVAVRGEHVPGAHVVREELDQFAQRDFFRFGFLLQPGARASRPACARLTTPIGRRLVCA